MSEIQQQPPIKYPEITVPGKGTYVVKFGLGAMYRLEEDLKMDGAAIAAKLKEMFPGEGQAGKVSPAFLLKVLSACIWHQVHLAPDDLGDCFEPGDLPQIAVTVMSAFSKTKWSAQAVPQETATPAQGLTPIQ